MSFASPKTYRDFYSELYQSSDIHATLNKHYIDNRKNIGIPYSKFIMNFLKYLTWNLKATLVKDFPKSKIERVYDINGFEVQKGSQFKTLNDPFKFRPINQKTLKILGITSTYYNTDAPELIPETGNVLPLVEDIIQFFNKKQEAKGGFGLVLGINCKNKPFILNRQGKKVYLKNP